MKSCPQCKAIYSDMTHFCVVDGTEVIHQDSRDPMLGKLMAGRFRLTQLIGEGGMGRVYKAHQESLKRDCAVKIIRGHRLQDPEESEQALKDFKKEAWIASRINHPHIVTIYDSGTYDDGGSNQQQFYLAMEYIEGETLKTVVEKQGPFPLERAMTIVNQLGEALIALHQANILHRDLKPANVMLVRRRDQQDEVKLMDFGIAKSLMPSSDYSSTSIGIIKGTPAYMSPEQVSGEVLDPRSDVYSFALMVYEMLTGRLPFESKAPQKLLSDRLTRDPIPLRWFHQGISPQIERVVMAALARDRKARTPTIRDFLTAFNAAAQSQTTITSPDHRDTQSGTTWPQVTPSDVVVPPIPPAVSQPLPSPSPPSPDTTPTVTPPPVLPLQKKKISWAVALASVVLLVLLGVVAWLYFRPTTPLPTSTPALDSQASSTALLPNATAVEHYQRGKQFQEKARAFAKNQQWREAIQENDRAIDEFNKALTLQPIYPEANESLALAFADACKNPAALSRFKAALAQMESRGLQPNAKFFINYGLSLYDAKLYAEAAQQFERALEIDKTDFQLLAFIGFALDKAGEKKQASYRYMDYVEKDVAGKFMEVVKQRLKDQGQPPETSGNGCFQQPDNSK